MDISNNNTVQNENMTSSLKIFSLMNLLVILTFFSPLFVAFGVLGLSFINQNVNGFIYLGFLIGVCLVREFIYWLMGKTTKITENNICNIIQFSNYENTGFSIFVFAFTIIYLCLPMFLNQDVNFWIFGVLLSYMFLDIGMRYTKACITSLMEIILSIITGSVAGVLIIGAMYLGGSSKFIIFNEISSTKEICSMPQKQKFKCSVYKNGELIGTQQK